VEGRQFINGKSHYTETTFNAKLLEKAIRLRRLHQRKKDKLSRLNQLKEKTICSNSSLDMTNDIIAMASNWEERLRLLKCGKKDDPQAWATSFPQLLTLTEREKA